MKQTLTLIVIIIAGAALTLWFLGSNSDSKKSNTGSDNNSGTTETAANSYKDGVYTTTVSYAAPEGHVDEIGVTITLADGVVSSLDVEDGSTNRESAQYQQRFIGAINAEVVGKDIDSVSASRVGGASLTSRAFNNALDEIKADAAV